MIWWLVACSSGPTDHAAALAYKYGTSPEAKQERRPTGEGKTEAEWVSACNGDPATHCVDLAAYRIKKGGPYDAILEQGCSAKDPIACKHLGYEREATEPVSAMKLLEQACALGSGVACQNVGFRKFGGTTAPKDLPGALEAWKKGCQNGYDKSCFEAGVALEEAADVQQAARFFHYACTMGYPRGCQYLSRFYVEETGVSMDLERAGFLACRECELQLDQLDRRDLGTPPGMAPCDGMQMLSRQRPESWSSCSIHERL